LTILGPFLTFFRIRGSFLTPFGGLFDTFGGSGVFFDLFGSVFGGFRDRVASGRSQLLIPGFRHAHTLQQLKVYETDVYSSVL